MNKNSKKNIAIIPAAGKPTNKIVTHTNLPDTMLPINGKPVIGYILEDLISRNITNIIVTLNIDDSHTENYIKKKFGSKMTLSVVYNDSHERGVGYSIHCAAQYLDEADSILIYLGDTIYKGDLQLEEDFLVVSSEYETSDKWCFVEESKEGYVFINKPKEYTGSGKILSGLYNFVDANQFKQTVSDLEKTRNRIEISDILSSYNNSFILIQAEHWYDCGNIENFYRAKIDFLRTRSFNTVIYNDLYGSITKTGEQHKKLEDEINWYKNIPEELKVFSPRLLDYSINNDHVEYALEYYGYQSLADYFVFNHFDEKVWGLLISRLFEILNLFKKYKSTLPFSFYDDMYRVKTLKRISSLLNKPHWEKLFSYETLHINDKEYLGWPHFEKKLAKITEELFTESEMTFIHGDLCLSNILFDPNNRLFKFIDPRGNFGTTSIFGDLKYDIAKLRHSFSGRYDFIISDLFSLTQDNNKFTFNLFDEQEHEKIANLFDKALIKSGYDINLIMMIEALLFISMLPIHNDAPKKQEAMFLTGIRLLNNIEI